MRQAADFIKNAGQEAIRDNDLRERINKGLRAWISEAVEENKELFTVFISDTVRKWDPVATSRTDRAARRQRPPVDKDKRHHRRRARRAPYLPLHFFIAGHSITRGNAGSLDEGGDQREDFPGRLVDILVVGNRL